MKAKCEKARGKIVGRSVFIETSSGAKAFVPLEKVCEFIKRFNICLDLESGKIKCDFS